MSISRAVSLFLAMSAALCSCSGHTQGVENNCNTDPLRERISIYWDGADLSAMDDEMREQSIVDYLYMIQHADSATRVEAWHILNAQLDNSLDRTVCDYLGDTESPIYAPGMLDEYLVGLLAEAGTDDTVRARAEYLLENIRKNRPGDVISDLPVVCANGTVTSLHCLIGERGMAGNSTGARRPRSILLFYDPECEACEETIEKLSADNYDGHTIIAISVTDTVKSLPSGWISTRVLNPDTLDDAFYLPTLPAIYTVSPAAIIISRP